MNTYIKQLEERCAKLEQEVQHAYANLLEFKVRGKTCVQWWVGPVKICEIKQRKTYCEVRLLRTGAGSDVTQVKTLEEAKKCVFDLIKHYNQEADIRVESIELYTNSI